jgi:hypothetical protein
MYEIWIIAYIPRHTETPIPFIKGGPAIGLGCCFSSFSSKGSSQSLMEESFQPVESVAAKGLIP